MRLAVCSGACIPFQNPWAQAEGLLCFTSACLQFLQLLCRIRLPLTLYTAHLCYLIMHMYCLQVSFFGERYPHFLFVDDIQFVKVRELTAAFCFCSVMQLIIGDVCYC
jgi:hypothetical protein